MWRIPRPASYIWLPIFGQSLFFGVQKHVFFQKSRVAVGKRCVVTCVFFSFGTQRNVYHKPILKRPFLMVVPRTSPIILRYIPDDVTAGT